MGFRFLFFSLPLILLSLPSLQASLSEINSSQTLVLAIKNYTFRSHEIANVKTGELHSIDLTTDLSSVKVDTIRLRCGSLQKHGAEIKEFHLGSGANVYPCTKRVILVRQNLGPKWSSFFYQNYDLSSNYQLISPVLGLSAYSPPNFTSIPPELEIRPGKTPITINFSTTALVNTKTRINPLCASFDSESGKYDLSNQTQVNVCVATRQGHFGLVVEFPLIQLKGKVSKWKIAIVSSIGGVLGACLLSLLLVAMFVNAKKKARMDEMERRAYEEEAFQVSMVGHVRAVTASGTRTAPRMEAYENSSRSRS